VPRLQRFKWDSWAGWAHDQIVNGWPLNGCVAFDTETEGLGFYDRPFCVTLTWRDRGHQLHSAYVSLEGDCSRRKDWLADILATVPTWIFHNAKFDLQKLTLAEVMPVEHKHGYRIEDTQTIYHLLDETQRKALKILAKRVLNEQTNEDEVLKRVRRKLKLRKDDGYQHIPREYLIPYALKDTEFTYQLWELGKAELEGLNDPALLDLYRREIELTKVLLRMEANGLALDMDYLAETTSEYGALVMAGWGDLVELVGDLDFNPQSPAQVKEAFMARGIDLDSTGAEIIKGLDDELARMLLQYRSDKKIHTTYLKALMDQQRDGIVHPWFNPTGARTGRMSSGAASN
jgi:DNA polymerase I-like protein with 3'-5' exonuclease and polymerase domains